jgi:hypothetical protein
MTRRMSITGRKLRSAWLLVGGVWGRWKQHIVTGLEFLIILYDGA